MVGNCRKAGIVEKNLGHVFVIDGCECVRCVKIKLMDAKRSNGADQSCCLVFSILQKKVLGASIATYVRYTSASKTDHLYTEISADNNIYVNDKRNCILRKTRAIKVCSARIAADISNRSCALCRYSKTKSLPNPQRVRVYCYIKILR